MQTNWKIHDIKRTADESVAKEVTYSINFDLEGIQDRKVGTVELPSKKPTTKTFIPFEELTEEVILGWVQEQVGQETIDDITSIYQQRLQQRLDRKNNPEHLTGLPWDKN